MLIESACYKRKCSQYLGISQPDQTELSEVHYCLAFPDGIPYEISAGENDHLKPFKDQDNEIVYEKGPFEWEEEGYVDKPIEKMKF